MGEELVEMLIGEGVLEYARDMGLIYGCYLEDILGILIFLGLLKLGEYVYTSYRGGGG